MIRNLSELWQYRALLTALTARELKARYRASVLGFLWTFLNPTLSMAVYVLVFGVLMKTTVERYPFYLFCGLLPWICFSSSILGGTSAVSDRKDLLTKVRFPAQVLPATVVATNVINFTLSLPILLVLGAYYQDWPSWHLLLAVPLLLVQSFFTLALTYLLSAINVSFRDLQHIVPQVVQLLFFVTPVVWPIESRPAEQQAFILYTNPVASIMSAWRDILYQHQLPALRPLAFVVVVSLMVMLIAAQVFERRREEFAELV
jgi:lipopolysaccharide transport system permease protein